MAIYVEPRNDNARYAFLSRAETTGLQDIKNGNVYITQETADRIAEFLHKYDVMLKQLAAKLSGRAKEIRERTDATEIVKTYIRDFWEVAKRRVHRLNQPAEVLTHYQLPLNGIVPKIRTNGEWLVVGQKMVEGDKKAVEAGYPAMTNPSAAELDAVLKIARTESNDVAMADREYDKAQEKVEKLRPQAEDIIDDVMAELRFNLRKLDDPSRRRIMRTYGAEFKYLKGEPGDEVELE